MLFYSFEFIYLFFPLALIGYFFIGNRSKHFSIVWLVCCSIFFYGWWEIKYVPLLIGSLLFNYYYGLLLRKAQRKHLLCLGVTLNLLLIGYYKYAGFFTSIVNDITKTSFSLGDIALPLGISFFTFQQIAWLVDSYRGNVSSQEKGLWEYGLFVTFFPQLIAGPIVHHSEMMPQFHDEKNRSINWANMSAGISIFIIGLAKKIILADSIAPYANKVFNAALVQTQVITTADAWLGAISYTLQLYFDFSGYADMAIGLALMCNIRLPINFDSPYKAVSIADFWRRWHITLSRFLKDYVYIPLGGNRGAKSRCYVNLLLTMLIGGLWHGAGWTFVLWGGLHGVFLAIHKLWGEISTSKIPQPIAQVITFICIVSAWVFFRAESLDSATKILTAMFNFDLLWDGKLLSTKELVAACQYIIPGLVIVFLMPNTQNYFSDNQGGLKVYQNKFRGWMFKLPSFQTNYLWLCSIIILSVSSIYFLLDQSKIHEFIYFQF